MIRYEFDELLVSYDPEACAAYIKIRQGRVDRTEEKGEGVFVDLDSKGNLLGIEILNPQKIELTIVRKIAKEFHVPHLQNLNPRFIPRVYAHA